MSTDVTAPSLLAPDGEPPRPVREAEFVNRPVWQLVVGAVVVVGVLWILGGWAVPFVIFAIVLMVVIHELGHFLTARLTGMKATEFFVGFGPKLWSKRVGETEYGLKGVVMGGYVRILGMTTIEQLDEADEPRSFRQATFPRRVLVASAGSIMHLLMALVLAWCSLVFFGQVVSHQNQVTSFTSWVGVSKNAAQVAGLQKNDLIESVNGKQITTNAALTSVIRKSIGQQLTMVVDRNGKLVTLHPTPVNGQTIMVHSGSKIVPLSKKPVGYIGVELQLDPVTRSVSLLNAVPDTFSYVGGYIDRVAVGTWHVFSPSGLTHIVHADVNPQVATSTNFENNYRPTSIYGIAHAAIQIAYQDPANLLIIFMLINLGVGLINMLPMLPLDGGYVAIAIYERIRTRRGQENYHADVNKLTPVVYAFLAILAVVFFSSLYLDIAHPLNF